MSAKDLTIHFPYDELRNKLEFIAKREFRTSEEQTLYFVNQAIKSYFSDPSVAEEYVPPHPDVPGIPF